MNVFYTLFLCFSVEEEKGDGSMVVVEEDGAKDKMDRFCLWLSFFPFELDGGQGVCFLGCM